MNRGKIENPWGRLRRGRHRRRPGFRPEITLLEGRQLLSTTTVNVITVTTTADKDVPPDQLSLRQAISQAEQVSGSTNEIKFASSLFGPSGTTPQTISLSSQLTMSDIANITIDGPGSGLLTIKSTGGEALYFNHSSRFSDGLLALSGLTITGGNAPNGGGLDNHGCAGSLADCVISDNTANTDGGGLANSGTLTLNNCTVSGNSDAYGNGGGLANSGTLYLTNCTISGNTNKYGNGGGGLANGPGGKLYLTNCTISGNSSYTRGGGLFNNSGTVTLVNVTVSGNTVSDSEGSQGGGGLDNYFGTMDVTNCTISGNKSAKDGGGLLNAGGTATLTNTIVADQQGGGDVSGALVSSSSNNLIGDGTGMTGITGGTNGNLVGVSDPGLAPLADNGGPTQTMALSLSSPAVGKGSAVSGVTTDQRGFPLDAPTPDIGAFQTGALVVNTTDDGAVGPGLLTLRQAINIANADTAADTIAFAPNVFGTTPQTIALTNGQLTLTDAATTTIVGPGAGLLSISGNNASRVFAVYNGSADISGLTVTGGNADRGGGIRDIAGALTLTDCTVSGNTASFYRGGGLYNQSGGTITLNNCTVSGNTAAYSGGGLENYESTLTLNNCTVSGNSAQYGGGLQNLRGTLALNNCTVSGNSASYSYGGLENLGGTATLTNTIVAGQTKGGDVYGPLDPSGSHNLIGGDPMLGPLANNGGPTQTMALLPGSPAINAGTNTGAPATDQRGFNRVVGGTVDIGAFEDQIVVAPPADQSAVAGQSLSIDLGSFSDESPSPGTSTVVVNFGDGPNDTTLSDVSPGAIGTVAHTFAATGDYTVLVTVSDAFGNANQASFTVNVQATTSVSGVSIAWGTQGDIALQATGDGDRMLPEGRSNDVPFANIDSFTITLGAPTALAAGDVSVTGIAVADYGPVTISGAGTTYTIALGRPIATADRVTIAIASAQIDAFTAELDVLPGDFNDDGTVSIIDAFQVRTMYFGAVPVTVYGDLNGDGVVNAADFNLARSFIGTTLPTAPPKLS